MGGKPRAAPSLTPADMTRCQTEKSNGVNFMTLGGRHEMVRCRRIPHYIAIEKEPNPEDGLRGSMSMCEECKEQHEKQMPGTATYEPIHFTVKAT